MTKQYDNELRGVLFRNKEKEDGDSKPDYTGSAQVQGVDFFMDAWINEAESGRKYMSVKFKPKQKQRSAAPRTHQQMKRGAPMDYEAEKEIDRDTGTDGWDSAPPF